MLVQVFTVAYADALGEWCVAVNSSSASLVRSRRGLYEALLRLEREGAVVVERCMPAADLALSASTCLTLWPEASLQVSNALHLRRHGVLLEPGSVDGDFSMSCLHPRLTGQFLAFAAHAYNA